MNIDKLNDAFVEIAEKKIDLFGFDPNDPQYDLLLKEIHQMEDSFLDKFGAYIEEALFQLFMTNTALIMMYCYRLHTWPHKS